MKTKIRFHLLENSQWGRYHVNWFRYFREYLTKYFDVECINYEYKIELGNATLDLKYPGRINLLSDVDIVVENAETGEFIVISFTEYFNSYTVHLTKNEKCKNVFLTHFNYHNVFYWMKRDNAENILSKVSPWIFGFSQEFDIEKYRQIRQSNENKITDKMFYKGSGIEKYRKSVKILGERNLVDLEIKGFEEYLESLCNHNLALSYYTDLDKYTTPFDHPGEFCYRDMEYVSLGVPFIRIEYKDSVYNGLYPNYHYISIPREKAHEAYKSHGDEGVADLLESKFLEIKDNKDFLNYISKNQIEWFDTYAKIPNCFELTINKSVLKDWIKHE